MHIIVIGAGHVGFNLTKLLSYEKHDVVIIEKDNERFARAAEALDAHAIQGNGTSYKLLEQAGIKNADLLVAVTSNDEVNLLSALLAKKYNVGKTIARVKNHEFLHQNCPLNAEKMDIDMIIHPESETAMGAVRLLKQSAANQLIEFAEGEIVLLGIHLDRDLEILRKPLIELGMEFSEVEFRTVAIQRKETTKIPGGSDMFLPNDRIFLVVPKSKVDKAIKMFGKENQSIENIMILGGGQTGYLIARELEKDFNVKIIESNEDASIDLAERLRKSLVIKGDGLDINLLALEGIIDMDAFIAVTGEDETNIVASLMAKHLRVPKIISLINKTEYSPIIPTIGIDAYLSKQMLTVNSILKYIRRGQIVSVASIPGTPVEAIELIPKEGSKITRKKLSEAKIPKNVILGAVQRDDEVLIPMGDTQIKAGDKVVLFALPSAIHDVEKIFN
ncbi:MAG: Trk system potassium transporter TrkA [Calditrichaeota bacterium]|nr:MAG: Trk system potassium transporter TrkA [Calditrichota bacterium]MBL1204540.1 Trk system potassium transporter TrkA [Calditrichota bacterium]NOG44368.1 Trk system potassium transporter TrkA [Calditrichota bacterium]